MGLSIIIMGIWT